MHFAPVKPVACSLHLHPLQLCINGGLALVGESARWHSNHVDDDEFGLVHSLCISPLVSTSPEGASTAFVIVIVKHRADRTLSLSLSGSVRNRSNHCIPFLDSRCPHSTPARPEMGSKLMFKPAPGALDKHKRHQAGPKHGRGAKHCLCFIFWFQHTEKGLPGFANLGMPNQQRPEATGKLRSGHPLCAVETLN